MDMQTSNEKVALAVDLDGTLISGDLLFEVLFKMLKQAPWLALLVPLWLLRGKAYFKDQVFSRVEPEPAGLNYRDDVVAFLRAERAKGRQIALATASAETHAQAIADHLGIFDAVMGSTAVVNLRADQKARELRDRYGEAGFDYIGNSADDIAVFNIARQGIAVAPDKAARQWATSQGATILCDEPSLGLRGLFKMLRVHQWAKNSLIAVPIILDHRVFDMGAIASVIIAFFAFSFMASAVYVFNDLFDLSMDRKHPTKRNRPLAAGRISVASAIKIAFALIAASIGLSLALPWVFWMVMGCYLIITTAYSLRIKKWMMIDVLVLAGLYSVRVLAGAAATLTNPSFWLLAFSMFFFLSLALVKRYVELDQSVGDEKEKLSGRGYRREDKEIVCQSGVASGFASIVVLALYLDSEAVYKLYAYPWMVWPVCLMVLYIIMRIWVLARRQEFHDDPVVFITSDWRSQCIIAVAGLLLFAAALVPHG